MNKSIYRAEINFDAIDYLGIEDFDGDKYLKGVPIHQYSHIRVENGDEFPVKEDTWSINFEDMINEEGNPLFASINKRTGKGGDLVIYKDYPEKYTMIYDSKNGVKAVSLLNEDDIGYVLNPRLKIVGIQE